LAKEWNKDLDAVKGKAAILLAVMGAPVIGYILYKLKAHLRVPNGPAVMDYQQRALT
jgi:hypothetical protein